MVQSLRGLALLLVLSPATALAQVDDDEVEPPIEDPNVPDDPLANLPPEVKKDTTPRFQKRDWPGELSLRPLTLAAGLLEASIDVPLSTGGPELTQILRGRYGLTQDLEVGLTWAVGLERLSADAGEDSFEIGKALSLDGAYTLIPGWLAAQLRLGFYFDSDHFGFAFTVGAPFRIPLSRRWILFGGPSLRVKVAALPVWVENPAANLAEVALRERGGESSDGTVDLTAGSLYQIRPNLAVFGTAGVSWPDFSDADQPFALFFGAALSRRDVDLGARLGWTRLDEPGDSFQLAIFAAVRL